MTTFWFYTFISILTRNTSNMKNIMLKHTTSCLSNLISQWKSVTRSINFWIFFVFVESIVIMTIIVNISSLVVLEIKNVIIIQMKHCIHCERNYHVKNECRNKHFHLKRDHSSRTNQSNRNDRNNKRKKENDKDNDNDNNNDNDNRDYNDENVEKFHKLYIVMIFETLSTMSVMFV